MRLTLVEIMITLAIIGIIAAVAGEFTRSIINSRDGITCDTGVKYITINGRRRPAATSAGEIIHC